MCTDVCLHEACKHYDKGDCTENAMIEERISKKDIINMICGTSPIIKFCIMATNNGYMTGSGGHGGPNWEWERRALEKITDIERLWKMYKEIETY